MPVLECLALGLWAVASPVAGLEEAQNALADFRPEDALRRLDRARAEGPFDHPQHVLLYELFGVAHAYLGHEEEAIRAFRMMLSLEPTAAISYTLSPKVTFLFEAARKRVSEGPVPSVEVRWPRNPTVADPVPVDVEVVADPESFLSRAALFSRKKGSREYDHMPLVLEKPGGRTAVEIDPVAPAATRSETLEIFLVAYDEHQNEVLLWGSPARPREIPLQYSAPTPWYGRWWVWVLAGAAVAAGTSAAVWTATREPPDRIGGNFRVGP